MLKTLISNLGCLANRDMRATQTIKGVPIGSKAHQLKYIPKSMTEHKESQTPHVCDHQWRKRKQNTLVWKGWNWVGISS